MSFPDSEITIDDVRNATAAVREDLDTRRFRGQLGKGEAFNAVFETMTLRFALPWKEIEIGAIPDYSHPLVQRLHAEVGKFSKVIDQEMRK